MLISDLTFRLYQEFINHLISLGKSKRTVEIIHGTMYGAMKRAKREKKIADNPCEDVMIYTTKEKREKDNKISDVKFIPYDKIGEFLEVALRDNYTYYLFFKFIIETGLRKGEALSLRRSELDLEKGRIKVQHTLDYEAKTDEELFGDTKTYHSERDIPIPKRLTMELRSHKVRQNDERQRFKETYKSNLDLVICRPDGLPLPKSTFFNAFRRILKKAGLPELPIHSLRHTHAVLMLEARNEMKHVQEALGHSSMKITADVYAHISPKIESDAMSRYEKHTDKIFKSGAEWGQKDK